MPPSTSDSDSGMTTAAIIRCHDWEMANSVRVHWRSPSLGTPTDVSTSCGKVRVFSAGQGEAIVFVHGVLVNANLWREVVPRLSTKFRCITIDLPLGSHELPAHGELSPPALARVISEVIEAVTDEPVTLVGNDTGGALSQIVAVTRPELVRRLVLTSCDSYDRFPPALFKPLFSLGAKVPGAISMLLGPMRWRPLRRLPIAYGWLASQPIDPRAEDSYILPAATGAEVRANLRTALKGISTEHTLAAAEKFSTFQAPVLIAWSRNDRFFLASDADRLGAAFPNAKIRWIENSRTFSAEDQPAELAAAISEFAATS